jgi:hypothetical protein
MFDERVLDSLQTTLRQEMGLYLSRDDSAACLLFPGSRMENRRRRFVRGLARGLLATALTEMSWDRDPSDVQGPYFRPVARRLALGLVPLIPYTVSASEHKVREDLENWALCTKGRVLVI